MTEATRRRLLQAAAGGLAASVAGCGALSGGAGTDGTPTLVRRRVPSAVPTDECDATPTGERPTGETLTAEAVPAGEVPRCARVAVHPGSALRFETRDTHVDETDPPAVAAFGAVVVDGRAYEPTFRFHGITGDGLKVTIGDGEDAVDEDADVVAYADLDRPEKELAAALLRDGTTFVDHHWDADVAWAEDHEYLRYAGRYYEVTVHRTTGDYVDHAYYRFRPLRSSPDGDPVVLGFPQPGGAVRQTLSAAVSQGSVSGEQVDGTVRRFVGRFPYLTVWEAVYRLRVE